MSDLVERLRRGRLAYTLPSGSVYQGPTLQDTEAANEIEALRSRVKQLEEVLRWVRANYASGSTREINARIDAAVNGGFNERD